MKTALVITLTAVLLAVHGTIAQMHGGPATVSFNTTSFTMGSAPKAVAAAFFTGHVDKTSETFYWKFNISGVADAVALQIRDIKKGGDVLAVDLQAFASPVTVAAGAWGNFSGSFGNAAVTDSVVSSTNASNVVELANHMCMGHITAVVQTKSGDSRSIIVYNPKDSGISNCYEAVGIMGADGGMGHGSASPTSPAPPSPYGGNPAVSFRVTNFTLGAAVGAAQWAGWGGHVDKAAEFFQWKFNLSGVADVMGLQIRDIKKGEDVLAVDLKSFDPPLTVASGEWANFTGRFMNADVNPAVTNSTKFPDVIELANHMCMGHIVASVRFKNGTDMKGIIAFNPMMHNPGMIMNCYEAVGIMGSGGGGMGGMSPGTSPGGGGGMNMSPGGGGGMPMSPSPSMLSPSPTIPAGACTWDGTYKILSAACAIRPYMSHAPACGSTRVWPRTPSNAAHTAWAFSKAKEGAWTAVTAVRAPGCMGNATLAPPGGKWGQPRLGGAGKFKIEPVVPGDCSLVRLVAQRPAGVNAYLAVGSNCDKYYWSATGERTNKLFRLVKV